MFIGCSFGLLNHTQTWGPASINSFRQAAGTAGGTTVLTARGCLKVGVDIAGQNMGADYDLDAWRIGWAGHSCPGRLACFAWIRADDGYGAGPLRRTKRQSNRTPPEMMK